MSHFPGSHTVSRFKHLSQNQSSHPSAIFSASWQQKWAHARHITSTFIYLHPEVPALKHIHMREQCHQHNRRQHQIARAAAQMKRHAKQRQCINRKQPFFNRIHFFQVISLRIDRIRYKNQEIFAAEQINCLRQSQTSRQKEQYIHPHSPSLEPFPGFP